MGDNLTLQDVQGLIAVSDGHAKERHTEVLGRFEKLENRIGEIEGTQPLIKGFGKVSFMIFGALVAGYCGSLFSGS